MAFVCFPSVSVRNRSCQRVLTHARVPRYLSCYLYFHQGKGRERGGLTGWGRLLTSFQSESGRSALPDGNVIVASCKCISPLLKNVFLPFSTSAFLVHGFYLQMHGIQANLTLTSFGKTLFAISHTFHYSESSNVFFRYQCTTLHKNACICSYLVLSADFEEKYQNVCETLFAECLKLSTPGRTGTLLNAWTSPPPHPPILNPTTVFTYCR